jgi:hypothetical protein
MDIFCPSHELRRSQIIIICLQKRVPIYQGFPVTPSIYIIFHCGSLIIKTLGFSKDIQRGISGSTMENRRTGPEGIVVMAWTGKILIMGSCCIVVVVDNVNSVVVTEIVVLEEKP